MVLPVVLPASHMLPMAPTRRSHGLEDGFVDKLGRDLLAGEPAAVELAHRRRGAPLVGKLEQNVAHRLAEDLAIEDGAVLARLLHDVLAQVDEEFLWKRRLSR